MRTSCFTKPYTGIKCFFVCLLLIGVAAYLYFVNIGDDVMLNNQAALMALIGAISYIGYLGFGSLFFRHKRLAIFLFVCGLLAIVGLSFWGWYTIMQNNDFVESLPYLFMAIGTVISSITAFVAIRNGFTSPSDHYYPLAMLAVPYLPTPGLLILLFLLWCEGGGSKSGYSYSNVDDQDDDTEDQSELERRYALEEEQEEKNRELKKTTDLYNQGVDNYNNGNYYAAAREFYEAFEKFKRSGNLAEADKAYQNFQDAQYANRNSND